MWPRLLKRKKPVVRKDRRRFAEDFELSKGKIWVAKKNLPLETLNQLRVEKRIISETDQDVVFRDRRIKKE